MTAVSVHYEAHITIMILKPCPACIPEILLYFVLTALKRLGRSYRSVQALHAVNMKRHVSGINASLSCREMAPCEMAMSAGWGKRARSRARCRRRCR